MLNTATINWLENTIAERLPDWRKDAVEERLDGWKKDTVEEMKPIWKKEFNKDCLSQVAKNLASMGMEEG